MRYIKIKSYFFLEYARALRIIVKIEVLKYKRGRSQPGGYLKETTFLIMTTLGFIRINLDYDLAEVPDRTAPPVIALDVGNSSSSASMLASDRVTWKYESYERLSVEKIGAEGARIPIHFMSSTSPRFEAEMWSIC